VQHQHQQDGPAELERCPEGVVGIPKQTLGSAMIVANDKSQDGPVHQRDADKNGCPERKDLQQRGIRPECKVREQGAEHSAEFYPFPYPLTEIRKPMKNPKVVDYDTRQDNDRLKEKA
jgi:hypothetical protein